MRTVLSAASLAVVLTACSATERTGATTGGGDALAVVDTPTVGFRAVTDTAFHPSWSRNAVIYEVNVRQYTPQGTFTALEQHLPRLQKLGVDILWLMPVQPIGEKNRKGPLGSYYAIRDYTAFNPEFGTEAEFRSLVDSAHALGMKVILDWVANHTAFDHVWTVSHPEYYEHRADGSLMTARDNENRETDWTDVAELDYRNAEMRRAMIDAMRWWVDSTGIDGFRCDVAGGAPTDFWMQARTALKADRPDLFLLAEAENPRLHVAFDMTYGWELHHLLNAVAQGKQGTDALAAYFARDDSLYGPGAYRMYFTSNHDENSWSGTEFERMGANHEPAFVLSATAQRSMPLIYSGQEVSLKKRLRFFEKDTIDWNGPSLADFYASVIALKHSQPALANGPWGGAQTTLATDGGDRVFAYSRTVGENTVVVALNFGDRPVSAQYRAFGHPGTYTDWFSKRSLTLGADDAIDIPPHSYRVLVQS